MKLHRLSISVGIEVFLGLNQGGGGMLDLEFFKKKSKKFLLQNSFLSEVDYISTVFYLGSYWDGAGES